MKITPGLLKKYFAGACTPEEKTLVQAYLCADDSDLTPLEALLEEETQHVNPLEIPPVMLKSIVYGIRKEAYPEFLKAAEARNRRGWYTGIAAVLLPLLVFVSIYVFQENKTSFSTGITAEKWDTVSNHTGSTVKAILPDGSAIWLTAKSRISYLPAQYNVTERAVRLDGEAFFEVEADPLHPFVVHHGGISTRVLGTAFNIEAYENEEDIRISLVQGKVAVNAPGDSAMRYLAPGEQLIYKRGSGDYSVKPVLYSDASTWKNGWMILDDVPLKAALQRLERQYGLQIDVPAGILDNRKITAVFKGGTYREILHNMLFPHRLRYTEKENRIYIEAINSK
ncbi:FecR family protein [Chitinophaga sp. 22620]|uniref:FecR family protein n=1 Tax=Chitinophaga sp. 22620 TaxID=3453952 RepID=UPI003F87E4A9